MRFMSNQQQPDGGFSSTVERGVRSVARENSELALRRAAAWFIDAVVAALISAALVWAVTAVWDLVAGGGSIRSLPGFEPLFNVLAPMILFAHRAVWECRGVRTYGQQTMLLLAVAENPSAEDNCGIDSVGGSSGVVSALLRSSYILFVASEGFGFEWGLEIVLATVLVSVLFKGRHPFDVLAGKRVIIAPCEVK